MSVSVSAFAVLFSTSVRVGETQAAPMFVGAAPTAGSIGLLVAARAITARELTSELAVAGCIADSLTVIREGIRAVYISGAPAAVNRQFPASLATDTAFFVKCSDLATVHTESAGNVSTITEVITLW